MARILELKCEVCRKLFRIQASLVEHAIRSGTKRRFCSMKCYSLNNKHDKISFPIEDEEYQFVENKVNYAIIKEDYKTYLKEMASYYLCNIGDTYEHRVDKNILKKAEEFEVKRVADNAVYYKKISY